MHKYNIGFKVSSEDLATIDANARAAALSRSEYLRSSALGQNLRTRAEEELYRELIRLGLQLKTLQEASSHEGLEEILAQIRQLLKPLV